MRQKNLGTSAVKRSAMSRDTGVVLLGAERDRKRSSAGVAARGWPETCFLDTESSDYDEAHFWLNGYVNKQNCRIWREANPQVYVEKPLHPEKLTVWCALWAGGILLQKR
ncbi:putative transposase [Trichonephila clavipes]|uniref:Putative transposase n=1 Tax=Trichonephila clavipes TaxID=2585209 RepID=A0A8X6SQF0_TRICX|nr:putative transposase [Trichonephila clavipes]